MGEERGDDGQLGGTTVYETEPKSVTPLALGNNIAWFSHIFSVLLEYWTP